MAYLSLRPAGGKNHTGKGELSAYPKVYSLVALVFDIHFWAPKSWILFRVLIFFFGGGGPGGGFELAGSFEQFNS